MALVTHTVVSLGVPTGVQILAGANREALGVAVAAGAQFVRAEGFAYAHVADEGWLDACAGELLRERRALGSDIAIYADIRKKHAAHAVTSDLDLGEIARGTAFSGADGLIVTGLSTGLEASPDDVAAARTAGLPVLVGSGITPDNIHRFAPLAHGLIVGSWLKVGGDWRAPVDSARVRTLRTTLDAILA
jgi:membrane complex biogenesis BtpA family protein